MQMQLLASGASADDSFSTSELTQKCICIPSGEDAVKIGPRQVTIKRMAGPCNISAISSWKSVNFEVKHVAYLYMLSDYASLKSLLKATLRLLIGWILSTFFLVQELEYREYYEYGGGYGYYGHYYDHHDDVLNRNRIAFMILYLVPAFFVVGWMFYFVYWLFFRSSLFVFGAYRTPLDDTWIELRRDHQMGLAESSLAALYRVNSLGTPPIQAPAQMTFASTTHGCLCLANGEDTLEVFPAHVKIKSTSGMVGHMCGIENIKQKTEIYLMTRKIRWLHFGNSGRSSVRLFFAILLLCPPFTPVGILVFIAFVLSDEKQATLALDHTPTGSKFGSFAGWGPTFHFRTGVMQNQAHIKLALLNTMLGRQINGTLLGHWKGKIGCLASCCGKKAPRLELYNDHVEMTFYSGCCCREGDNYCILLRDIKAIHAGVVTKNVYLHTCVVVGQVLGVALVLMLPLGLVPVMLLLWSGIFFLMRICSMWCCKEATVCIGSHPGGAPHTLGNPFGNSPFWVNFKTAGNQSVDSIIEQIRLQQDASACNQVGVPLAGHDLGMIVGAVVPETPMAPVAPAPQTICQTLPAGEFDPNTGQPLAPAGGFDPNTGQPLAPAGEFDPNTGQPLAPAGGFDPNTGQPLAPAGGFDPNTGQPLAPAGGFDPNSGQPLAPAGGRMAPTPQIIYDVYDDGNKL